MNVRKIIPVTDRIRALLTEATIDMPKYSNTAAQLAVLDKAAEELATVRSMLVADLAIEKAAG